MVLVGEFLTLWQLIHLYRDIILLCNEWLTSTFFLGVDCNHRCLELVAMVEICRDAVILQLQLRKKYELLIVVLLCATQSLLYCKYGSETSNLLAYTLIQFFFLICVQYQGRQSSAPVASNHGKLWGRARARGAGVERLKDHRCMPVRTRNERPTSMT